MPDTLPDLGLNTLRSDLHQRRKLFSGFQDKLFECSVNRLLTASRYGFLDRDANGQGFTIRTDHIPGRNRVFQGSCPGILDAQIIRRHLADDRLGIQLPVHAMHRRR